MSDIEIKAVDYLTELSSGLIHAELSENEIKEHLLMIFSIFMNMEKDFSASTVAEDVTFELFKYTDNHDNAYRKWREEALGAFKNWEDLLPHIKCEQALDNKDDEQVRQEKPNILDLSTQAENLNINAECLELAEHISAVLSHPRTPEQIRSALKDGMNDLELPKKTMESPEFIAEMLCDEANQNKEAK